VLFKSSPSNTIFSGFISLLSYGHARIPVGYFDIVAVLDGGEYLLHYVSSHLFAEVALLGYFGQEIASLTIFCYKIVSIFVLKELKESHDVRMVLLNKNFLLPASEVL